MAASCIEDGKVAPNSVEILGALKPKNPKMQYIMYRSIYSCIYGCVYKRFQRPRGRVNFQTHARAPRARDAWGKITEIYGNPRAGAARAPCIDFLLVIGTVLDNDSENYGAPELQVVFRKRPIQITNSSYNFWTQNLGPKLGIQAHLGTKIAITFSPPPPFRGWFWSQIVQKRGTRLPRPFFRVMGNICSGQLWKQMVPTIPPVQTIPVQLYAMHRGRIYY
jgi:hypothetical protein